MVVPLAFLLCATLPVTPAAAEVSDVGYEGLSTVGTGTPTGSKRAESVLWWNDGFWWGNMWDSVSADFHIFRLDTANQTWVDTGVVTDRRANTHSDVLWDGSQSKLYVASHRFVNDGVAAVSGYPSYLYRFSYNASTKTYALDTGFPEQINNMRTETLVIDKDSTGQLWATWQQDNQIYLNRTTSGDRTWGSPFPLPATGTAVTVDDISALESFGGNKIGVMWSNQGPSDAMYFAVHHDGAADDVWETARTAFQGSNSADDHISLKTLVSDSGGRVYAAIKTSFTSSAQPLIMLLERDPATGDWESFTIARVSDCPNRPSLLIDEQNGVVHAFYTAPGPPGYLCNSSGGAIYEKTAPLSAISFPLGSGTPLIMDADTPYMHNASSTKQNVNAKTGMAVLAVNSSTDRYWHSYQTIPGGTPASEVPAASFTAAQAASPALTMAFTDTSTNSPTSWSWDFGDGTASTVQHPTHTYASAGTYEVTLTASNSSGSSTATNSVTVVAAPVASFTSSTTGGVAPLAVTFTDTSTNSPTAWSWDFGDGTTSTAQHPSHAYASAGTYSVTLIASNPGGSSTSAPTTIVVTDFGLTASPSSQSVVRGGSVKYEVTVTPQNGFDGAVTLSVRGLGSGATATFEPNPTSSSAVLTISTTTTAKNGTFTLTIDGASGTVSRSTTVTLQVKRK